MHTLARTVCVLAACAFLGASGRCAEAVSAAPVNPDASPEARALLQFLYDISGKYMLTGQHNPPNGRGRNSQFAAKYIGKTPVIFGSDWGHAKAGDSDSYLARPDIVQEAIRQHRLGSIVALCWHAVPPTANEPITFRQIPNSDPKALSSVQGKLLDEQFRDVLAPGTALYDHWCAQVDTIAAFLKQLQDAHVPVLWRPYHEMNGDWFWWGGRTGEYSTIALYRQIFDRLVNHHHLNNLIWVWSMDRPSQPGREHAKYFPGSQYVDVLALDVYGNDFNQSYYDSLVSLSGGKPLALAEVGSPPTPDILGRQPRWTYFMTWSGMVRNTPRKQYEELMRDPRVLGIEDQAYCDATANYRKACGLEPLRFTRKQADFSGSWVLDEDRSDFGRMGAGFAPARLDVVQTGTQLSVATTRIVESADDQVTEEKLTLDGAELRSEFMNSPRVTTARLSEAGDLLLIESVVRFAWGQPGSKTTTKDTWKLIDGGRHLSIQRFVSGFRGEQNLTLVFDRR
ncbi:MAG TPA: glycosyl hydrolase [Opitutaceae bacterium]|nr:glycosyl hydrolase [Opitutaceae bacterium]